MLRLILSFLPHYEICDLASNTMKVNRLSNLRVHLLQFYTDLAETLMVFSSWNEDVHVV